MKIPVRVKPKKKEQKVKERDGIYWVWLKSAPENGQANRELIKVLAKHFGVTRAEVEIITGHTSRNKVVEIAAK